MTQSEIAAVILAAGQGSRMKSALPKVLHKIGGREMIGHVMAATQSLAPARMTIVTGDNGGAIERYVKSQNASVTIAIQSPPQGTGDAVAQATPSLIGFDGVVLILYADTPLITPETLRDLAIEIDRGASVAVLGFSPADAGAYGRLKRDETGALAAIVEANDASPEELAIGLCNSGVMAFDAKFLRDRIGNLKNDNKKKEYYLTDMVAIARSDSKRCAIVEADERDVIGVNSRDELSIAEAIFQNRRRNEAMINGATLADPATIYFSYDTQIGCDVVIGQSVVFAPGVTVGDNVEIKPFCHLEGATVASGAKVGPFARLRPGADLRSGAKVGNFVEIKNTVIGDGAKVSHLTYIGDAEIGAGANIGAGTITCNYDGYGKHKTTIGAGAFIGSNSSLVAPVTIGDGAYVGSGSVITKNVEPGDLAVARGRQAAIKGWAGKFHKTHQDKD